MKSLLLGLALARGLDVTSTCMGEARGWQEANPLMPGSCRPLIGVEGGLTAVQWWGLSRLQREHPKVARWIAGITLAVEAGMAARNFKEIRR